MTLPYMVHEKVCQQKLPIPKTAVLTRGAGVKQTDPHPALQLADLSWSIVVRPKTQQDAPLDTLSPYL